MKGISNVSRSKRKIRQKCGKTTCDEVNAIHKKAEDTERERGKKRREINCNGMRVTCSDKI